MEWKPDWKSKEAQNINLFNGFGIEGRVQDWMKTVAKGDLFFQDGKTWASINVNGEE